MFVHLHNVYGGRFEVPSEAAALHSKVKTWSELLHGLDDEVGLAAARLHCERSALVPTPADLLGLVTERTTLTPTEAWELVWSAACIGGSTERGPDSSWPGEVLRAVNIVGWSSITMTSEPHWVQRRFEAAYGDFSARTEHEFARARLLGKVPDGLLPQMKSIEDGS